MWTVRCVNIGRMAIGAGCVRRTFSQAINGQNRCLLATAQNTPGWMHLQRRGARKWAENDNAMDRRGRGERSELGLDDDEVYSEPMELSPKQMKKKQPKQQSIDKKTKPKKLPPPPQSTNTEQDADDDSEGLIPSKRHREPKPNELMREPKSFRKVFSDESLRVYDAELDLEYVKLRYNNAELQTFMLLTKSRNYRMQHHLLMVEGRRLLLDALDAGLPLKYLLFSRHDQLKLVRDKLAAANAKPEILRVPHHDLSFWSVMTTCPGIIGLFEKPLDMQQIYDRNAMPPPSAEDTNDDTPAAQSAPSPRITVIIDQIRDPSNLGSVIRTCAAIPCKEVLLTKGCADPWETKALRGGAGGQFRLPVRGPMDWSSIESILPDSGAYSFFIADNNSRPAQATPHEADELPKDISHWRSLPYTSVSFERCQHAVLVIGGETEGISREAYNILTAQRSNWTKPQTLVVDDTAPLASENHHALQIPLANGVESLNTNAAASILLFEIRRQMLMKKK